MVSKYFSRPCGIMQHCCLLITYLFFGNTYVHFIVVVMEVNNIAVRTYVGVNKFLVAEILVEQLTE